MQQNTDDNDLCVMAFCGNFLLYTSHLLLFFLIKHAMKKIQIITRLIRKEKDNGIDKYKWFWQLDEFLKGKVKLFTLGQLWCKFKL